MVPPISGYITVRLFDVTIVVLALVNFIKGEYEKREDHEVFSYDQCCGKQAAATSVATPCTNDHIILVLEIKHDYVDAEDKGDVVGPGEAMPLL